MGRHEPAGKRWVDERDGTGKFVEYPNQSIGTYCALEDSQSNDGVEVLEEGGEQGLLSGGQRHGVRSEKRSIGRRKQRGWEHRSEGGGDKKTAPGEPERFRVGWAQPIAMAGAFFSGMSCWRFLT